MRRSFCVINLAAFETAAVRLGERYVIQAGLRDGHCSARENNKSNSPPTQQLSEAAVDQSDKAETHLTHRLPTMPAAAAVLAGAVKYITGAAVIPRRDLSNSAKFTLTSKAPFIATQLNSTQLNCQ